MLLQWFHKKKLFEKNAVAMDEDFDMTSDAIIFRGRISEYVYVHASERIFSSTKLL